MTWYNMTQYQNSKSWPCQQKTAKRVPHYFRNVNDWAERNKLWLNCARTKKIVFRAKGKRGCTAQIPPPCDGFERVSRLTTLGVVINDRLTPANHVSSLSTSCSRPLYALRVLRNHGISAASMSDIFRSDQQCWPSWCTARLRGRASAQQPTEHDAMRSCAGVNDSGTAAERRQRLPNCLMKLTSRCLAAY